MSHITGKVPFTVASITALILTLCFAEAAFALTLPNGMVVRLHGSAELAASLQSTSEGRILNLADGTDLELLTGVEDARLPRRDVRSFQPMDQETVVEALAGVDLPNLPITIDIYLLPAPPAEVLGSFARRNVIFLSPGFGAVDRETLHALVVHELGHVLTWAYFDHAADAWNRYYEVRGLDPAAHGPTAVHAERAREILAEDIRALFGDPLAAASPIENSMLVNPAEVPGLKSLLGELLRGEPVTGAILSTTAWPNPCRPNSTMEMALVAIDKSLSAGKARLDVMDVRGRVIRTVVGGKLENGRIAIRWNGRDDGGRRVAAGHYYYRIAWGSSRGRGAVTLLR